MALNIKNPEVVQLTAEVARLAGETKTEAIFSEEFLGDLLGGVVKIRTTGVANSEPRNGLYFPSDSGPANRSATITAIPYYANANRGSVDMGVWIPVEV
jgi:DUF1680 family protein